MHLTYYILTLYLILGRALKLYSIIVEVLFQLNVQLLQPIVSQFIQNFGDYPKFLLNNLGTIKQLSEPVLVDLFQLRKYVCGGYW